MATPTPKPTPTPTKPTPTPKSEREKEAEEIARMTRAWESVTISSSQKEKLSRLSKVIQKNPRREVDVNDVSSSSSSSSGRFSREGEKRGGGGEEGGGIDFVSGKKIDTSHTFYLWFDHMHKELEEEEERIYTNYIHRLECYEDLCNQLVKEVEKGMDNLSHMQHQFEQVSAKANLLREACDIIMREKAGLVAFVDSIEEKLKAYDQLSIVEGKVDRFMEKNPLHSDLVALLGNLDECSSFIHQSAGYHKSEIYRAKFQQIYSRALALVKLFVVSNIRSHTSSLARQIQTNNTRDSYHHIVTTTMRRLAASLRPLFVEIERRGRTDAYVRLLVDCQYAYFNERRRLVVPHLSKQMDQTVLSSPLKEVVRTACGLLIHTAQTEHQLVSLFFHSAQQGLEDLLSSFSGVIYEHIRPLVLNSSLDELCSVASVIQSEVMHEQLARRKDITSPIAPMFQRILQDVQERLVFLVLMFIRNDIGSYVPTPHDLAYPERLRGGVVGKWEGLGGGSMNGKLLEKGQLEEGKGKEKEGEVVRVGGGEEVGEDMKGLQEVYEGWFPTLGRALVVLSKIYEVLDRKIFEELANDIVCDCTASLVAASGAIGTRSGEAHGALFLLKHLVILREQISPFDVEFSRVERRLDFSSSFNGIFGLSVAVSSFLRGQWSDGWKSVWGKFYYCFCCFLTLVSFCYVCHFCCFLYFYHFFTNNFPLSSPPDILQASSPKIRDSTKNSKRDVEKELMKSVDQFVSSHLQSLLEPLITFLAKCTAYLSVRYNYNHSASPSTPPSENGKLPQIKLSEQPFARPAQLKKTIDDTQKSLKDSLPSVLDLVSLYLSKDCPSSQMGLYNTLGSGIIQQVHRFYSLVERYFSEEEIEKSGVPPLEETEKVVLAFFPSEVASVVHKT